VSVVASFRVDDRLIHGQVMVGWVRSLGISRIILANNDIACDTWRTQMIKEVVDTFADDVEIDILELRFVTEYITRDESNDRILLLVESIEDALSLFKSSLPLNKVNLGGIHTRTGRVKILPYLFLDSVEIEAVLYLHEMGIRVIARDFPDAKPFDVANLIKRKRIK